MARGPALLHLDRRRDDLELGSISYAFEYTRTRSSPLSCANIRIALLSKLLADDSSIRLRRSDRIFVVQATKERFHKDERTRLQTMAGLQLRGDFMFLRGIRHPRPQRTVRTPLIVMSRPLSQNRAEMYSDIGIIQSRHSRRMVPITRSQIEFALGLALGPFALPPAQRHPRQLLPRKSL
jgi:hypothetical protein